MKKQKNIESPGFVRSDGGQKDTAPPPVSSASLAAFTKDVQRELPELELLLDLEDRLAYGHGAYPLEYKWILQGALKHLPSGIVRPRNLNEVSRIVAIACRHSVPIIPFGGGSGIVGGTIARRGEVVVDTKLLRAFSINHKNCTVAAGAGWSGAALEDKLNHHGYTSGHFPQSFQSAVLGGMVATRAIGTFSTKYGKMDDIVTALEVVLPSGEILRTHRAPKRSTGPELMELFLGSEGVYGIVTEVEMKIHPRPEKRIFDSFTFPTTSDGLEAVRNIIRLGLRPAVVRLYDEVESKHKIDSLGYEADRALLYLGYEGLADFVGLETRRCFDICMAHGAIHHGSEAAEAWFRSRFSTKKMQDYDATIGGTADAIEVAAPWDRIETVWREMRQALEPIATVVDCHFSHFYHSGASVYVIFHAETGGDDAEGERRYRECLSLAVEASISHGGNVSHHHGVGLAKAEYMEKEHGVVGLGVMRHIKDAIDPQLLFNAGVLGL